MKPYKLSVATDASGPAFPTASLVVTARYSGNLVQLIELQFRWRDRQPAVRWSVGSPQPGPMRRGGGMNNEFAQMMFGAAPTDDWQNGGYDDLDAGVDTSFPTTTHAMRALVGMAMAWEASPVRNADLLLRKLQTLLTRMMEAELPKPPGLPEVDMDGDSYEERTRSKRKSRAASRAAAMLHAGRKCPRCGGTNVLYKPSEPDMRLCAKCEFHWQHEDPDEEDDL